MVYYGKAVQTIEDYCDPYNDSDIAEAWKTIILALQTGCEHRCGECDNGMTCAVHCCEANPNFTEDQLCDDCGFCKNPQDDKHGGPCGSCECKPVVICNSEGCDDPATVGDADGVARCEGCYDVMVEDAESEDSHTTFVEAVE